MNWMGDWGRANLHRALGCLAFEFNKLAGSHSKIGIWTGRGALDNRTQAIVSHSLSAFSATRIVIAHRLSTIVNADRILVVEKGSIVQSGSYPELTGQEGLFRELAKRQLA